MPSRSALLISLMPSRPLCLPTSVTLIGSLACSRFWMIVMRPMRLSASSYDCAKLVAPCAVVAARSAPRDAGARSPGDFPSDTSDWPIDPCTSLVNSARYSSQPCAIAVRFTPSGFTSSYQRIERSVRRWMFAALSPFFIATTCRANAP